MGNMFAHSYSRALAPALVGLALVACDNTGRGPGTNSTGTRRDAGVRFDGGPFDYDSGPTVITTRRDSGGGLSDGGFSSFIIDRVRNETTMSDDQAAGLFAGDPNGSLTPLGILYPIADAMMPANVRPPLVQWQENAVGDVVRLQFIRGNVRITVYTTHANAFSYQMLPEDLQSMQMNATGDIELSLTYHDSNGYAPSSYRYMKLASGRLYGSVYYWNLNNKETERVNVATAELDIPVPLISTPLAGATGPCMACHAVSRDGTRLFASNLDTTYSFDVTTNPAQEIFGVNAPGPKTIEFGSYDPDRRYIVGASASSGVPFLGILGYGGMSRLTVYDAQTGLAAGGTGIPDVDVIFASWSPDGTRIAYTTGHEMFWGANPTTSNLNVVEVAAGSNPPAMSNPRMWLAGNAVSGPEGGASIAHPTWAPNSQFLIFQHGQHMFSSTPLVIDLLPPTPGRGERWSTALYLVGRDGGSPRRLTNASGPNAWWPTFSPFITGEEVNGEMHRFGWVLFFSRRNYGNSMAGTGSASGDEASGYNYRQLWVAAVDLDSTAEDPSFAPYRIDGQDSDSHNAAAYWAPEPCRGNGDSCSAGSAGACCTGYCDPDTLVCAAPPEGCRELTQRCSEDTDCCGWDNPLDPVVCVGNICDIFIL